MSVPNRVINALYLISFVDLFAVGLTFPVLAPHIRSLGVSHLKVGLLSSTYSALQVLSGPIFGSWSDIRGRKPVFIVTLAFSAVCYLLLGLCSTVYGIFIFRLLLGIFKQTQTLNKAITADYVSGNDNSKVFGRSMAFSSLGFVVGPFIGGHLADMKHGFMYICAFTAFLFIINIGLVLSLPNTRKKKVKLSKTKVSMWRTLRLELKKSVSELKKIDWSEHWVSFTLKFLFILSTTVFFVNQSLHLKEKYQLPQKYVGYAISFVSTVGVITSFFSGTITRMFYGNSTDNCIQRAYHCFLILSVCFMGFYWAPNYYVLLAILLPFGVCNAILRIVTMEITFSKCREGERGTLTGASESIMSLARFLAPMSAGFVGDIFNENAVMLYATVPCFVGVCICYFVRNKHAVRKEKVQ